MYSDTTLEYKFDQLNDIPFDYDGYMLLLSEDWWIFPKGTQVEKVWEFFNSEHSKGIEYLFDLNSI